MYTLSLTKFFIVQDFLMSVNFILAPFMTMKALKKIKEIMNNLVNDSYSRISIWILKIVVIQEVMVMVALSLVAVVVLYGYIY